MLTFLSFFRIFLFPFILPSSSFSLPSAHSTSLLCERLKHIQKCINLFIHYTFFIIFITFDASNIGFKFRFKVERYKQKQIESASSVNYLMAWFIYSNILSNQMFQCIVYQGFKPMSMEA